MGRSNKINLCFRRIIPYQFYFKWRILYQFFFIIDKTSSPPYFPFPPLTGRAVLTLYIMSDSYLGLDQQYDIPLDIIPASLEAQVNSELVISVADEEVLTKWLPPPSDTPAFKKN